MKFARYNSVKQIINDTVYQQGMHDYCMSAITLPQIPGLSALRQGWMEDAMIKKRLAMPLATTPYAKMQITSASTRTHNLGNKLPTTYVTLESIIRQFAPAIGDLDSYDILDYANTTFPSENYLGLLADPAIMAVCSLCLSSCMG